MTVRQILIFPHPNLRRVATPVTDFDEALQTLVDDMFETMYDADGVGLAATQIDVHRRIVVMDCSEGREEPIVMINPELLSREGESTRQEGCLSIPGVHDDVTRPATVRFRAQNRDGETYERDADGLLAACVQHEIDHLDGKLFVDYLSTLKQQRIKRKMEKQQRQANR